MIQLRVTTRIYLVVATLVVVALTVGLVGISTLRDYKAVVDDMSQVSKRAVLAERVNGLILSVVMDSRGIYMAQSTAESEKYAAPLLKTLDRLRDVLVEWQNRVPAERQAGFLDARAATDQFIRFRTELVRLSRESTIAEARAFGDNDANRRARAALNEKVKTLAEENEAEVGRLGALVNSTYGTQVRLLFLVLAVGVMIGTGLAVLVVSRKISTPLNRITATMKLLAAGDHQVAVPYVGARDEIGTMAAAVQVFKEHAIENDRMHLAKEGEEQRVQEALKTEMLSLAEVLEGEVSATVGDILVQVERLSEGAAQLSETSADLRRKAEMVAGLVETTSSNVQTVAGATEELEASSRGITEQVSASSRLSEEARLQVDSASNGVAGLTAAATRIGDIVALIRSIAGQTRMLALNATIEAARAGDAGKGFAVVAEEVKGLASQTDDGIARVNAQAEEIASTVTIAVEKVEAVAATIRSIDAIASQVAAAADEQRAATGEIMQSAVQAATHTRDVASHAQDMLHGVDVAGNTAKKVNDMSMLVQHDVAGLQRRISIILRNSHSGNRRGSERVPVALRFNATIGGHSLSGHTGDISMSGALLVATQRPLMESGDGMVQIEGVGQIPAQLLVPSQLGFHVRFIGMDDVTKGNLATAIEQRAAGDQSFIAVAQTVARDASAALEKAIRDGGLSEDALFDINYTAIEGSDPPQVLARHAEATDKALPHLLEAPLASNPNVVFCCATDRNGYIATHNRKYSQPQRPGEREWNIANSRHRRIFDDRAAILAARNTKPYLAQTYGRDMGGSSLVILKEIDAPITVNGKHWGAVRLAIKL